jgi:glycosyltransferase involved in cell wall biosynthesis
LNGVVTNYSNKIIVHSDYSKELLLEKNLGHKVNKIHHYARIKKQNKVRTRAKLNISTDSIVISAFGHIHETKRVFPILNAFKQLAEEFGNLYLYFVGKPAPHIKEPLKDFLTENNLTDKVIITGYSSHETFEDYMDTANICLNLRFPYNGETSGSLMRMLGKGKCVLVNDLGSFSEVPDDACVKLTNPKNLSVTEESNMIYKKLKELINDPGKTDIISRKAIEYAENNLNLELISKKYTDFLKDSSKSLLNNQLLDILIFNLNRDYSDKEVDFYELAKTLSFSKM